MSTGFQPTFTPLLWQNSNLEDPRQIREYLRQQIPFLLWVQQRLVAVGAGGSGGGGTGTGDMTKAVYDTNNNGIVDSCDSLPYSRLTGVPTTFAPSAHASTHLSAGSDPIAIATSVLAGLCPAVDNTTIQVVASKLSCVALAWTAITGKPAILPDAPNDANTYGRHAAAWSSVLPITGGTISGPLTVLPPAGQGPICLTLAGNPTDGWAQQYFNKASGSTGVGNAIVATVNGPPNYRWALSIGDNTVESGGNVGSDFKLESYSDAGASLGVALKILRATLATQFGGPVTLAADPTIALGAATKQYVDSSAGSRVPTSRQILTTQSITGGGDLSADRTLSLVGDTPSPGGTMFYGTNGAGVRGWYVQPSGTGGDMTRAVYDTNLNGVVDTCDSLAYSKITGVPLASSSVDGLLKRVSGLTTDLVDGTNNCQSIDSATRPTIYSVRLRSMNAVGNPTFEVTQRNIGNAVTVASAYTEDRWAVNKNGMSTGTATAQAVAGVINIPGTSFAITNRFMRVTLTAQQASLAAGDLLWFNQQIEGSVMRELFNDVHSVSLLVRSSVANLSFGLALRDPSPTRSLTKLCTLGAANTWTLITLPNLPVWAAGGGWTAYAGSIGYQLSITLASGSTFTAPANDTWQNGNFIGAVGQSNFAASAVNSTFDIAFAQHEPGSPTALQDLDFDTNLSRCQRYFTKSYAYLTKAGTVASAGAVAVTVTASAHPIGHVPFKKVMAKTPTITTYSSQTGTANAVYDSPAALDRGVSAVNLPGESGFGGVTIASFNAAATWYAYQYIADTGW